jgi:arginine utilization protein RocB
VTYQAEIKKKEKEVERVLEKWQKVADSQTKLGSIQSGMRCANVTVLGGAQVVGRGLGFLDIALEQAEQARNHLSDDNLLLRKVILKTINELQSLQHKARSMLPGDSVLDEVRILLSKASLALLSDSPCSSI